MTTEKCIACGVEMEPGWPFAHCGRKECAQASISSNERVADIDLDALIEAYHLNPRLPLFRDAVLLCLRELKELRSVERVEHVGHPTNNYLFKRMLEFFGLDPEQKHNVADVLKVIGAQRGHVEISCNCYAPKRCSVHGDRYELIGDPRETVELRADDGPAVKTAERVLTGDEYSQRFARHPDGRRKGTSPLTASNLAARIAGAPPEKTSTQSTHPPASVDETAKDRHDDKCEHGLPRRFCTAAHGEKTKCGHHECAQCYEQPEKASGSGWENSVNCEKAK